MDFVNRLKLFLEQKQIPVTQFADNCRIPRPTLSQLLNGRNKKVSDEVIGKIHDAYPNLSIMWLMFGEGAMMTAPAGVASTIQQSAPLVPDEEPAPYGKSNVQHQIFDDMIFTEGDGHKEDTPDSLGHTTIQFPEANTLLTAADDKADDDTMKAIESAASAMPDGGARKRVVNIIVYYDDNTFQAFVPDVRR